MANNKQEGLTEQETEEKKALEEKRKAAGDPKVPGEITDSERTRLSELLAKEEGGKQDEGGKPKAAPQQQQQAATTKGVGK